MSMLNLEECELLGDSKYRAYISQVDKALKNFESTYEWADLISALGKLNKILSSHVKYPVIPRRVTIGKRLAQCLHPALPSGVHLRALETYDIIFKCIGTGRLAADLFTYSAGLFPLLGQAAMNVKPTLLALYETHVVPLGKHVKPAMTGLLLGLLPGLEEGSEYFDRVTRLLEEFVESTDPVYFYGCLWECVLSSPSVRLAAINFVLAHYNRKQTTEDQLHIMGTNIDLMIEAMCTSVQDASVLVQRSALDLLLCGFPMHNSQLTRPDMVKVITAVVKVVLRRDMSLNRRLYAWLLGADSNGLPLHSAAEPPRSRGTLGVAGVGGGGSGLEQRRDSASTQSSEVEMDYFNTYSKELLILAVKNCIQETALTSEEDSSGEGRPANLRPFRILISLLDKPEIGSAILEDILLEVFRCMYRECMAAGQTEVESEDPAAKDSSNLGLSRENSISSLQSRLLTRRKEPKAKHEEKSVMGEIVKTANLLFGAFEPYFIWDFIGRTFERSCIDCGNSHHGSPGRGAGGEMSLAELCNLVDFLLDKVSLETYIEIQTEHIPELLRQVTLSLSVHCDKLTDAEMDASLKLCSKLLGRVLPSVNPVGMAGSDMEGSRQNSPYKMPTKMMSPEVDDDHVTDWPLSESDVFMSAESSPAKVRQGQGSPDARRQDIKRETPNGYVDKEQLKSASLSSDMENGSCRLVNGHVSEAVKKGGVSPDNDDIGNTGTDDDSKQNGSPNGGDQVIMPPMSPGTDVTSPPLSPDTDGVRSPPISRDTDDITSPPLSPDSDGVGSPPMSLDTDDVSKSEDTESFNDFVQYGDNFPEEAPQVRMSPRKVLRRQPWAERSASLTLMQTCVQCFHKLFVSLIASKIIRDPELPNMLLRQLVLPPQGTSMGAWRGLDGWRPGGPPPEEDPCPPSRAGLQNTGANGRRFSDVLCYKVEEVSRDLLRAFGSACQLLVDLSSFPMYCTNYHKTILGSFNPDDELRTHDLPEWLRYLLTCACFVDNFAVQSTAIATLQDLVGLTQSVLAETQSKVGQDQDQGDPQGEAGHAHPLDGTVSVVMQPSLTPQHLHYINTNTNLYKIVTRNLWLYLGDATPQCHARSVELLFLLHQMAPDPWVCEDVIGNDLLSDNKSVRVAASQRFVVLWHLLRDRLSTLGAAHDVRTFDRSMLVFLDPLQSDIHPCRALTQTWLTHAIQRGDITRVLEPILVILLHPDTARISIQHVNIHEPKRIRLASDSDSQSEGAEAKIYAISSEGGNVIYHVSSEGRRPMTKKGSEELQTLALTTLTGEGGGSATRTARGTKVETELHFEKVNPIDLNLRLNPFGSQDSLDRVIYFDGFDGLPRTQNFPDLQKIRRLNAETCKQEGISFDWDEQGEEEGEEVEELEEGTEATETYTAKGKGTSPGEIGGENGGKKHAANENSCQKQDLDESGVKGETAGTNRGNAQTAGTNSGNTQTAGINNASPIIVRANGVDSGTLSDSIRLAESNGGESTDTVVKSEREGEEIGARARAGEVEGALTDSHNEEGDPTSTPDAVVGDLSPEGVADELTPEGVVGSILAELVETAMRGGEDPETWDSSSRGGDSQATCRPRLASMQSTLGENESKVSDGDTFSEADVDGMGSTCALNEHSNRELPAVHPLHTHILLYTQKYDAQRTLYAMSCLRAILATNPRLVTCALATTSLSSADTPHPSALHDLLLRHRRSVFGKNFFSDLPGDLTAFRNAMLVEILISLCLYFTRSYYPNLMMSQLCEQELNGNKEVQILGCEVLTLLLSELINIAKDSGKGFSTYIGDLLARCKVQKTLLHCVLASVYNARQRTSGQEEASNFTEAIISFNEENMDANTNETFQVKLLKLLLVIMVLEDQIRRSKMEADNCATLPQEWERSKINFQSSTLGGVRFFQNKPVVYQGMLLSAVLSALKQQHLCHMHRHWVTMVISAMPYMCRALSHTLVSVTNQLCKNIEILGRVYEKGDVSNSGSCEASKVPPDHLTTLLESLTTMCHYCLLDSGQQDIATGQPLSASSNNIVNDTSSSGHIFSNLVNVFTPYGKSREPSPAKEVFEDPRLDARRHLLNILPRIVASLLDVWKAANASEKRSRDTGREEPCWTMGLPKNLRKHILEFLSPISKHHACNLIAAMAIVWHDRRQRELSNAKRVISQACEDQLLLVDLVSAMKVLPTDTLMQTVKQVLKTPPPPDEDAHRKRTPVEVSLLQFFYCYIQRTAGSQLLDTWSSLLGLLRDGLQLSLTPLGQFLLLLVLNEFVQKIPGMFSDRKDQKDLQEIAQKLLEACSEIAGSSLEQTTFFRRNLAVKPGPQVDVTAVNVDDTVTDPEVEVEKPAPEPRLPPMASMRQFSVQALVVLAELTASLLDVVYRSEEKDRVVPLLHSIMHNVFPYLKNHSPHNLPSFRACSQMLASLSSYQYTRKAWKKEAFDLLMDHNFFQMDEICIAYWRVVIDNLMTHDKTTFKDLLARVTVAPGAALNLFSSRDQEFELRAQLLKRLSFTIFCSEVDQYQRHMPDIQERLADSLRLPSVPSVQAQVFMCLRVLVLRISPQHLTSLWPTIITELIHILLQIEQELTPTEVEESRSQAVRASNLDPSWSLGNGLKACNNPSWMKLYLAACKLLDLALVLPAEILPQFQLYRWAFTGDPCTPDVECDKKRLKEQYPTFVPHVIRIARLMDKKYGEASELEHILGRPLLTVSHIRVIEDLHPFFHTVALLAQTGESLLPTEHTKPRKTLRRGKVNSKVTLPKSLSTPELRQIEGAEAIVASYRLSRLKTAQAEIEQIIEMDFLEPLPRK